MILPQNDCLNVCYRQMLPEMKCTQRKAGNFNNSNGHVTEGMEEEGEYFLRFPWFVWRGQRKRHIKKRLEEKSRGKISYRDSHPSPFCSWMIQKPKGHNTEHWERFFEGRKERIKVWICMFDFVCLQVCFKKYSGTRERESPFWESRFKEVDDQKHLRGKKQTWICPLLTNM